MALGVLLGAENFAMLKRKNEVQERSRCKLRLDLVRGCCRPGELDRPQDSSHALTAMLSIEFFGNGGQR